MRKTTPLHDFRRARTFNQQDLARLAGVSQQTLSKFERGLLMPSPAMQARLATLLGVSVRDLFEGSEDSAVA